MPFGKSKSLRAKRSNTVRPNREAIAPAPRRSIYIPPADPPQGDSVLRTSMIFSGGPPDPVPTPKPAASSNDLHLVRTNPEMSSEGPQAALEKLERATIADNAYCAAPFEQATIQPSAVERLASSQNFETPVHESGDGRDKETLLIGMALGDPAEDVTSTANQQNTLPQGSSDIAERPVMPTTEGPSVVTDKTSEEQDLSSVPSTKEDTIATSDQLDSEKPSTTSSSPMPRPDRQREALELADANKPLKRKPSRWNILGGWFGKKAVPQAAATTPIYQMRDDSKPRSHHKEKVMIGTESLGVVPKGKDHNHRSRSSSTRLTKTKGGIKPTFRRTRTAPTPHPPELRANPSSKGSSADNTFPKLQLDGQPMLTVDIPDIQLDRYSVMFGGLLQPKSPATSQPSLLVRRQAHLENVRTDGHDRESEDQGLRKSQRRATSPSYTKSPSLFSLFPSTPTRTTRTQPASKAAFRPSPLHRSNTTPGALSPIRQIFETPDPTDHSPVSVRKNSPTPLENPYPTESPSPPNPYQQTPPNPNDQSNQQSETDDSPFFTPPHSPPTLTPNPSPHPHPATNKNTAFPFPTTPFSVPSPATHTSTTPSTNPTISIARQISITRRQRQLHVPFDATDSERLVDRRPMTPTLVNVRSRSSSVAGAESRSGLGQRQGQGRGYWDGDGNGNGVGNVARKSQRVVVECVEG